MDIEILTGLAAFSFASSITPGPNNLMLMASGANYGFRRTVPHLLGVGLGFVFMVLMVGVGLVGVFNAIPASYTVLKVVSVAYLLYLAARIATAAPPSDSSRDEGRPFTFLQAAAFQWVNPKAWTMALTSVAVYAPSQNLLAVSFVALVFGVINLPCVSAWTVLGEKLRSVLASPRRLRAFNWLMALLLVGSLYPVVLG
ncbi:MAG: LysE family translocator, partial [Halieaceae bacterium]|jgi:threonine/homoserine/homoserine lactone efflux protein|nr:LysE family translocator [Halieaceae bacterium]